MVFFRLEAFQSMCCDHVRFLSYFMVSSCSFRITRTAEDLAQTINALSQRLVKLEERLHFLEKQLNQDTQQPPEEELKMLDGVDQLLAECHELLESSSSNGCDDLEDLTFIGDADEFAA